MGAADEIAAKAAAEIAARKARLDTLLTGKLVAALEAAGVEFTNGERPGVRLKARRAGSTLAQPTS